MSENQKKMVDIEDVKVVGIAGLIMGLGIWLFPRTTATLGAVAIIGNFIDKAQEKSDIEKAAEGK